MGVALIVIAALLRSWPAPGTLVLPFLTGGILEPLLRIAPTVHGYLARLVVVTVATWLMALGGALSIRCAFGASAYSQVMLCVRRLTGWRVVFAQLSMELTVLVLGWALGGAIGVGTIITGLLIGPSLHFWLRLLGGVPQADPAPEALDGSLRTMWERRRSGRPNADRPVNSGFPSPALAAGAESVSGALSGELRSAATEVDRQRLAPDGFLHGGRNGEGAR